MRIAVITEYRETKTGIMSGVGVCLYTEVTDEQYKRIEESYNSGKFEYMNEDESLKDVVDLYWDMALESVRDTFGKDIDKYTQLIPYPEQIKAQDECDIYDCVQTTFEEEEQPLDKSGDASDRFVATGQGMKVELGGSDDEGISEEELQAIINEAADEGLEKSEKIWARLDGTPEEVDSRYETVMELQTWMVERGFERGEEDCNLLDEEGWCIEALDLGWPNGIGRGLNEPVAVQFYHTTPELLALAKEREYRVFESVEEFKEFIEKNYGGADNEK